MAMRMAFRHFKELPKNFRFIADGYSAYPLAAQQFFHEFGDAFKFCITQVIGLTNDDAVSKEFRPFKQMIERLNRTYKASYRKTNGFDNIDGANYDLCPVSYTHLDVYKRQGGFISGISLTIIFMQIPKLMGSSAGSGEIIELAEHIYAAGQEMCIRDRYRTSNL